MALQNHELEALILAIHEMDAAQKARMFEQLLASHPYEEDRIYMVGMLAGKYDISLTA